MSAPHPGHGNQLAPPGAAASAVGGSLAAQVPAASPTGSGSRPSSAASPPCFNPFALYESLGVIGRGKYSEVHKARDRSSGEIVAMKKVAIFEMDSDGRKECINEANILQALPSHPHIIKYKHSYLYENDLYLILELAEGGDISLLLEQQRKKGSYFQEAEIWHYFVQIADALHVMHSCRVMHRDIKPANIFLTGKKEDNVGLAAHSGIPIGLTIKLGDLGLGRYLSSKTYETFSMVGTPFYMSPEAIANTGYEFKSDIWSCGCLLYEIAALKSPFYSTSLNFYTLGNKITKAEYEKPPAHFSKTLHALINWMIQPQPEDRPDIGQVLRVAQAACESIARTGTVLDSIPVGPGLLPPSAHLPQNNRPGSKQGGASGAARGAASGQPSMNHQQQPQQQHQQPQQGQASAMSDD